MAQLPPKIPITATISRSSSRGVHRNSPSLSFLPCAAVDDNSCSVDDFLNFTTLKRDSHRRSISDSVAVVSPKQQFLSIFNDAGSSDTNHGLVHQLENTAALERKKDDDLKKTRKTPAVAGASDQIQDSKRIKRYTPSCRLVITYYAIEIP